MHACLCVCEHVLSPAHVHAHMCTVLHVGRNSEDSEFSQTTSPLFSCHDLIHLLSSHTDLHSLLADKSVLLKSFHSKNMTQTEPYNM